eukprot:GHVT01014541.1.p1 GENE.GHVT01014541.1~~GHVT01014541.1.p1  ORF type:complete len:386 (+),score=27.95 GHVT01014541.1:244-1401(+)
MSCARGKAVLCQRFRGFIFSKFNWRFLVYVSAWTSVLLQLEATQHVVKNLEANLLEDTLCKHRTQTITSCSSETHYLFFLNFCSSSTDLLFFLNPPLVLPLRRSRILPCYKIGLCGYGRSSWKRSLIDSTTGPRDYEFMASQNKPPIPTFLFHPQNLECVRWPPCCCLRTAISIDFIGFLFCRKGKFENKKSERALLALRSTRDGAYSPFFETNNLGATHHERVNKFIPQVLEAVRKGNEKLGVHIMTDLFRPLKPGLDILAFPWHWDAWVAQAKTAAAIKQELLDVLPPELEDDSHNAGEINNVDVQDTAILFAGAIHGPDTFKQMRLFQAMRNMDVYEIPFHRPSEVDEKEWNQMEPYMNDFPGRFDGKCSRVPGPASFAPGP